MEDLILKDGPLTPVWLAGTMNDKIGKKVVLATDITKISNQILQEDRLSLVLRLSGMLLKGVVIMYSKKVQYMLIDCEEVITKIKESFKPIQVNLPGNAGNRSITLGTEDANQIVLDPVHDITEWIAAQNPEETFEVAPLNLNMQSQAPSEPGSESSQLTQTSVESSQLTPNGELDEPFTPLLTGLTPRPSPNEAPPTWAELPDSDDFPPQDFGDVAPDLPVTASSRGESTSEAEAESESTDAEGRKIVDGKINVGKSNYKVRHRPKATRPKAAMPQNEELNRLFEMGASQNTRASTEVNSEAEPNYPVGDFDFDDGVEVNMNEGEFNRAAEERGSDSGISAPQTPKLATPNFGNLGEITFGFPSTTATPFDDGKFKVAVEPTPMPKLEDSIDSNTKKTLLKLQSIIPNDGDKTTFQAAYQGSSKHQSALAFYQMLVLKSARAIDIKQDNPLEFSQIEITADERFHMFN